MGRITPLILAGLFLGGCASYSAPTPTERPWPQPMTETTCVEWEDEMTDDQRFDAAKAVVGFDPATRLVFAINDFCKTLHAVGADPSDPAMISDIIEIVIVTEDF
jgi:hypothetical protein